MYVPSFRSHTHTHLHLAPRDRNGTVFFEICQSLGVCIHEGEVIMRVCPRTRADVWVGSQYTRSSGVIYHALY